MIRFCAGVNGLQLAEGWKSERSVLELWGEEVRTRKRSRCQVHKAERREHSRIQAHLFTVFKRTGTTEISSLPKIGYTRDVSGGGAYFFTRSKAREGDEVALTIHLANNWAGGGSPAKLEGEGQVLRVEKVFQTIPPGEINGVAVQFGEDLDVSF